MAARAGRAAVIGGSLAVKTADGYVKRFLWAEPDGTLLHYDKRHLFAVAGEDRHYRAGQRRVTLRLHGWRVVPFICYDLRFPVWCRSATGCDLMVFVANWPRPRHDAWTTLLRARAIENQCYVAGVNRVGSDANQLSYRGGSAVIDCLGATVVDAGSDVGVRNAVLSARELNETRAALPFFRDADRFELHDGSPASRVRVRARSCPHRASVRRSTGCQAARGLRRRGC